MKVSVIIVNYNSSYYLENCLKSIYEQTKNVNFEIIVVDNASSEDGLNKIEGLFPDVVYIHLDTNLGFGGANNVGAEYARGEYLFFLNPDTILLNDAMSILSDFLDSHEEVALCGGTLLSQDGKFQNSFSDKVFSFWSELAFVINFLSFLQKKKKQKYVSHLCKIICGADMMIRKTDFESIGRFDIRFFMYYEEPDFSKRITQMGKSLYYVRDAEIIHLEGKSFDVKDEYNKITKFYFVISQLRFIKKYYRIYYPIFYASHFFKACLANVRYLKKDKRQKYWRQYLKSVLSV